MPENLLPPDPSTPPTVTLLTDPNAAPPAPLEEPSSVSALIADLENNQPPIEDEEEEGNQPPAPTNQPPAPTDDEIDDDRLNAELNRRGMIALPNSAFEPPPTNPRQVQELEDEARQREIEEADQLEYLRIAQPDQYQAALRDQATRAVGEHFSLVDSMVDDIRAEVNELDEDDLKVVKATLRKMTLSQLKAANASKAHLKSAKTAAYDKVKSMKPVDKKPTPPSQTPKANERPNRINPPAPKPKDAAAAGLSAALSRKLRSEVNLGG